MYIVSLSAKRTDYKPTILGGGGGGLHHHTTKDVLISKDGTNIWRICNLALILQFRKSSDRLRSVISKRNSKILCGLKITSKFMVSLLRHAFYNISNKFIGGSQGVPPACPPPPPTGSISLVFTCIFAKKCMRRRSAPPNGSAPPPPPTGNPGSATDCMYSQIVQSNFSVSY